MYCALPQIAIQKYLYLCSLVFVFVFNRAVLCLCLLPYTLSSQDRRLERSSVHLSSHLLYIHKHRYCHPHPRHGHHGHHHQRHLYIDQHQCLQEYGYLEQNAIQLRSMSEVRTLSEALS